MLKVNNFSIKFVLKLTVIQQLLSYVKFLWHSTNQHGVHSPFVYNLITKCFYVETGIHKKHRFKQYKNHLFNNTQPIEVNDLGAGSKVFTSNKRSVKSIAKNAGISKKKGELLIRLVAYFKPTSILELGTSVGLSTFCIYLGNKNSNIITMEGCLNTAKIAEKTLKMFGANPNIVIGNFDDKLAETIKNKSFDLIYLDGNHQKNATLRYFEQILNVIHNDSILIFDDIHWSDEMTQAWEVIKNHPKVTVSIDTYFWGIVFFRKEQVKEHFIIRI